MRHKPTIVHAMDMMGAHPGRFNAILRGLPHCQSYQKAAGRNMIIAPMPLSDNHSEIQTNPLANVPFTFTDSDCWTPYAAALKEVEQNFGVSILVGKQNSNSDNADAIPQEIILIDPTNAVVHPVNAFKAWLFEEFGIESIRYEHIPQFEHYVKFAPAALAALRAMRASTPASPGIIISYDYPAMPLALAALMDPLCTFKTLFYALEVPTVRQIVENHPGHDAMLLHTLQWAKNRQLYLPEIFGSQDNDFKFVFTRAAKFCDHVTAANRKIFDELHFLSPDFKNIDINIVPVGLSVRDIPAESRIASKYKLQAYTQNLLGFTPDHIFSHVGSMSVGKALWRDIRVLEHLDRLFTNAGRTGVYYLLSTDSHPKSPAAVRLMEQQWQWPVAHREIPLDLTPNEAGFYTAVQNFNSRSQNIKIVFINQYDFNPLTCGQRMPVNMTIEDLYHGCDVAFGQSVYDASDYNCWLALPAGALVVVSRSSGFYEQTLALTPPSGKLPENIIVADYTRLNQPLTDLTKILAINQGHRDAVEYSLSEQVAQTIMQRLPQNPAAIRSLIAQGRDFASQLDWEISCREYILPNLQRAKFQTRNRRIA